MLSIFNFMQEAASSHADALGVSIQQLLSENYTWLLSRVQITMTSYPAWTDDLTVLTWPSGMQRLFALRDFQFKDQKDSTVGAALSAWLVIDTHKRRPVRIAPFIDRLKPVEGDHILPGPLQGTHNRLFHHGLYREEDGQELVRAKTVWQPA
jgi:acyl-ACP thioesterase